MFTLSIPFSRTIPKFSLSTLAPEMLSRSGAVGAVRVARLHRSTAHPLLSERHSAALETVPPFFLRRFDLPMSPPVLGSVSSSEKRRRFDAERRQVKPSRRWYGSSAWRAISIQQLAEHPFCISCYERDGAMVPATVCDHIEPHREDYGKFWYGKRQSLCTTCHSSIKQREEQHLTR